MKKKSGLSLVEVIVATTVLGVAGYSVVTFLNTQRTQYAQEEKRETVHRLLEDNIAEVNSKKLSNLPTPGNCLVRYYTLDGQFVREAPDKLSAPECTSHIPESVGIKVIWAVRGTSDIDVSFSPNTLKLPRHVHTVNQITLYGGIRPTAEGKFTREYSITTFKRDT